MAGYEGYSKSNNAIDAEDNGRYPVSIIAKKLSLKTDFIKKHFTASEWHHTSKFYNSVDYYDLDQISDWLDTDDGKAALLAFKSETRKVEVVSHTNCAVKWLDWYGTRNQPWCNEMEEVGATVSIKGKTATIVLVSGKTFTKRLNTNGFSFKPL